MRNLKVGIYSIKDDLAGFMNPFCEHSNEGAERQLELLCKKDGTLFGLHPEQFNLFKIGVLDTETGDIDVCMEFVQNGAIYRKE